MPNWENFKNGACRPQRATGYNFFLKKLIFLYAPVTRGGDDRV